MQHDLYVRVGEHCRQWFGVEVAQRIEDLDPVAHHHLDQAEQRPEAPLGDELGVEPEPAVFARRGGELSDSAHDSARPVDGTATGAVRRVVASTTPLKMKATPSSWSTDGDSPRRATPRTTDPTG